MMQQSFQSFHQFLQKLEQRPLLGDRITDYQQKYTIRAYSISQITLQEAENIYNSIYSKFYKNNHHLKSSNWFENQLRLFVWIVISYAYIMNRHIEDFAEEDWQFFGKIFDRKDPKLFQYQCHCLYLSNKGINWHSEQQTKLRQIIDAHKPQQTKIRWNQISKQLFQKSDKKYLRTPKQCRQRWNNHLDPKKMKGMWKRQEYIRMFEFVRDHGKKWAQLVKQLNNVRNEHSIKNKFNSMVKRHIKTCKQKGQKQPTNQKDLYNQIIQKVQSAIYNEKYCKNHNEIDYQLECPQDIRPIKRSLHSQSNLSHNLNTNQKRTSGFVQKLMLKLKSFPTHQESIKKKEQEKGDNKCSQGECSGNIVGKEKEKVGVKDKFKEKKQVCRNDYQSCDEDQFDSQDAQEDHYNSVSQSQGYGNYHASPNLGIIMPQIYHPTMNPSINPSMNQSTKTNIINMSSTPSIAQKVSPDKSNFDEQPYNNLAGNTSTRNTVINTAIPTPDIHAGINTDIHAATNTVTNNQTNKRMEQKLQQKKSQIHTTTSLPNHLLRFCPNNY